MRKSRIGFSFVVISALLLVGVRAAMPYLLQRYVNRTIDRIPEYQGSIGDVDLHLWRGAYQIEDIKLEKMSGEVPVPFFSAARVDLSLQWSALLDGRMAGEIDIREGELNLVDAPSKEQSQTRIDDEWLQAVKDLTPFDLNRFAITDSQIHFRNFHSSPPVDIVITDLSLHGENFRNVRRSDDERLPASVQLRGKIQRHADAWLNLRLDPMAGVPTFNVDAEVKELELTELNDFLRAYSNLDAEAGKVGLYLELAAAQQKLKGYLKPVMQGVDLVDLEKDKESPLTLFWEGFAEILVTVLRNQPKKQLATSVPISGSFDQPQSDVVGIIANTLRNAFVEAYKPSIEGSVSLDDVT